MQPVRIEVRFPHRSIAAVDDALADRVTSAALFVPFRLAPVDVDVGTWVRFEALLDDGTVGLGVDGVTAWRYVEGTTPPGHEAGVGVAIVAVDVAHRTRFSALVARTGLATRVRPPGLRLMLRQRLPGNPLPVMPARTPVWTHATQPPGPAATPPAAVDGAGALLPSVHDRLAVLTSALGSMDVDATADGMTTPPTSTESPASSLAPSSASSLSPFVDGAQSADAAQHLFDDAALPFATPNDPAFERGSTDVDLLASVSAQDFVSLHGDSVPLAQRDGDIPSMDAELVEDASVPSGAGVARALPGLDQGNDDAPTAAPRGLIGYAFTAGPRGLSALEAVHWPVGSSRRAVEAAPAAPDADADVFAGDALYDGDDPFAPRTTDPGMSVDGVVARAVEAAQQSDIDADNVFGSSAATGDGQPVDADPAATRSAEATRDSDSVATGDDGSDKPGADRPK